MKLYSQKGFTAIMALLFVVLLAIVAGTGYYVWNAQKQADKTLTAANNEKFATPSKKAATKTATPSQQYLTIKEWGVKLPLSVENIDAYYTYDTSASLGTTLYDGVTIHDKSFDQVKNTDGVSCSGVNLYAISRIKTQDVSKVTDPKSPDFIGDSGPGNFKSVAFTKDFEFAGEMFSQAPAGCEILKSGKTDEAVAAKYETVRQALDKSFGQMQAQ